MTIRARLFTGYAVLILIFSASLLVNYRLNEQVRTNFEYLSTSEAIIRNSNLLHKQIIDMQNGYRGFLLTGQETFLEPYFEGVKQSPVLEKNLMDLVSNPMQVQRLDSIVYLQKKWQNYADELIKVRNDTLPSNVKLFKQLFETKLKNYVGKRMNDRMRDFFMVFDDHEYEVRKQRRSAVAQSIRTTERMNVVLVVVVVMIAILLGAYIVRLITRRISEMVILAEQISRGEFRQIEDRSSDELHRLSASLNSMSETLEQNFNELHKKNKDLDDFAYVVSHDLKAPLRGIENLISWMEEDHAEQIGPELKKSMELIRGRVGRLEAMINGLLAYARIGKTKREPERVDVGELMKELKDLLVPPGTKMTWDAMPVVHTDRVLLSQVFSNLISNAVKYNDKAEPAIHISVSTNGDFHEFCVSDNGVGIQQAYFGKIFQIFQTLRERDAFESTGVGLAIVKRIVEEQNGAVRVESQPSKGSTFCFTWHKN
jgi:signal transduction histidine kinase